MSSNRNSKQNNPQVMYNGRMCTVYSDPKDTYGRLSEIRENGALANGMQYSGVYFYTFYTKQDHAKHEKKDYIVSPYSDNKKIKIR
jgi:hypothetical protein